MSGVQKDALLNSLAGSYELEALVSLAYNGPGTIGKRLSEALLTRDRQEAWFEIRYATNDPASNVRSGIAKRRFVESQIFGLYNDESNVTASEARDVYKMLTRHHVSVIAYEKLFGRLPDDSHPGRDMIDTDLSSANETFANHSIYEVDTLAEILIPARDAFVAWVNSLLPPGADALVAAEWNPASIYFDPDSSTLDTRPDDLYDGSNPNANMGGPVNRSLVVGVDGRFSVLYGGAGDDYLIGSGSHFDLLEGGTGNDVLMGRGGSGIGQGDVLQGGEGFDTYVFQSGSGRAVITGGDNDGRIVFDGVDLTGAVASSIPDPKNSLARTWQLEVGVNIFYAQLTNVTEAGSGTLSIWRPLDADSTISVTDFESGDLGISLATGGRTLIMPGLPGLSTNPWVDPDVIPTTSSGTLPEGAELVFTVFLDSPAPAGSQIRFSLPGSAGDVSMRNGAEVVAFGPGNEVVLSLEPGQSSVTLTLVSDTDIDVDRDLVLTSVMLDSQGTALNAASSLNVHLSSRNEDPGASASIYTVDPNHPDGGTISGVYDPTNPNRPNLGLPKTFYGGDDAVHHLSSWSEQELVSSPEALLSETLDMSAGVPRSGANFVSVEAGLGDSIIFGSPTYRNVLVDGESRVDFDQLTSGPGGDNDLLCGGSQDDVLITHGGDDVVYGRGGTDAIIDMPVATYLGTEDFDGFEWVSTAGNSNRDRLYGEAGDDLIVTGAGDGYLNGGVDNDQLFGGTGNDTLVGGTGNDVLSGDGRITTLIHDYFNKPYYSSSHAWVGLEQPVYRKGVQTNVTGTIIEETTNPGDDFLDGEDGDDRLTGGGGSDVLYGGRGNDTLQGDTLQRFGGVFGMPEGYGTTPGALQGDDVLYGESGVDHLLGGGGADRLEGGDDDDILIGDDGPTGSPAVDPEYQGNDILIGGAGNDQLVGDGRDDQLFGGSGNDILSGDSERTPAAIQGNDVLDGGAGNDTLIGWGGADRLFGGDGDDILLGDGNASTVAEIPLSVQMSDHLDGGAGDDVLLGGGGDDVLLGGSGADELSGEAGNDELRGGDGNDQLFGGAGDDLLDGGAGSDALFGDDGNDTLIGDGFDLLEGGAGDDTYVVVNGFATIRDNQGRNTIAISSGGSNQPVRIAQHSQYGGDLVIANADGQGVRIVGGLLGSSSQTLQIAGQGDPTLEDLLEDAPPLVIGGADEDDAILGGGQSDFISAGGGSDGIQAGAGNDFVHGESGADNLRGDAGDDSLYGGNGDDSIEGGEGDDVLFGGDGNDSLAGGTGDDQLFGGEGNDTYQVNLGDGADTVLDAAGTDTIAFGAGIALSDIHISGITGTHDLLVRYSAEDSIRIKDGVSGHIESYAFADGTVMTHAQLMASATVEGITLMGDARFDTLLGTTGEDTLLGAGGSDWLSGAGGNDFLDGGTGNDTFVFGLGDGSDTVVDASGNDTLSFGPGITAADITAHAQSGAGGTRDLLLQIGSGADRILIRDGLNGVIETFQFDDGSWLTTPQVIRDLLVDPLVLTGTTAADQLQGGRAADRLAGGAGYDTLTGGDGQDTYELAVAGDTDTVIESAGQVSTIALGAGVSLGSLVYVRQGDDLRVGIGNSADALILQGYYSAAGDWTVMEAGGASASVRDVLRQQAEAEQSLSDAQHIAALRGRFVAGVRDYVLQSATPGTSESSFPFYRYVTSLTAPAVLGANGSATVGYDYLSQYYDLSGMLNQSLTHVDLSVSRSIVNSDAATIQGQAAAQTVTTAVLSDVTSTSSSDVTQTVATPVTELETRFASLDELLGPLVNGERPLAGVGLPPGSTPVYADVVDESGNVESTLTGYNIVTGSRTRYVEQELTSTVESTTHSTEADQTRLVVIEEIRGGASNNAISYVDGAHETIDAGAGDDVVGVAGAQPFGLVQEALISSGNGTDVMYRNDTGSSGVFIFGNAGNDVVIGSSHRDELIGGRGDDFLNGMAQGDVYTVLAGNQGWDVIYDAGTAPMGGGPRGPALPDAATLPRDVVRFESGIRLADLSLSWGAFEGDTRRMTLNIGWGSDSGIRVVLPDAADQPGFGIEQFEFADGTRLSFAEMLQRAPATPSAIPSAPVQVRNVANAMALVGEPFTYTVPRHLFLDSSTVGSLAYEVTLADGTALPSWLTFDADSRTLQGDPQSANLGTLALRVTATDSLGASSSASFNVTVTADMDTTIRGTGQADTLAGTPGDDRMIGYAGNDVLSGGAGNDTLNGGPGADTLIGGTGDDFYVVDDPADTVTELAEEGTDLVRSTISYTLGSNVENLTLVGTAPLTGTGNALDNALIGNDGNNVLSGGAGDDSLNGGAGADSLIGGTGNDLYTIDNVGDVVVELAGEGVDRVRSSISYTLGDNVENLSLLGSNALSGTGNALDNLITGNAGSNSLSGGAGNDTLNGGEGADTLIGGAGNDAYVVDHAGDSVVELQDQGVDIVRSWVDYTLGANVENLTLLGNVAIAGTGNDLDNILIGNAANNTLIGGAGNDTLNGGLGADAMSGGAGDDSYVVENTGDVVTENANQGVDLVRSSVDFTLGANVENLTLFGTASVNGTGNALDNTLVGNAADNVLTGGLGNDSLNGGEGADELVGGAGNDVYTIDNAGDTVLEQAGEGVDLVRSYISHTLGSNVENLTLLGVDNLTATGNALDNLLIGNEGDNVLDGGSAGADTLRGGLGNDTYIVDRASGTSIAEAAGAGTDLVRSSVTQALTNNVELLFLTGSDAIDGTGNGLNNFLRGNAAANTLRGGAGNDVLNGGDGDDLLADANGQGIFIGGAGDDSFTAGAGNDLLIGGIGNDVLRAGEGSDVIVFNKGDGADTVTATTRRDNVLSLGGGATYADLLFQKTGNNLVLKVGATDQITFAGYYASGSTNRSVDKLQVVIEGTSDYLPGGGNVMRDNKIETFNFEGLVAAFDAARAANPSITTWALNNALASQYLAGSDTAAIGGDLAYRYNRLGSLSDISFSPALAILSDSSFGTSAQVLRSAGLLQDSTPRLS